MSSNSQFPPSDMRSFLAVKIGLFTALPIIIFILAAIAEPALCIFALRAETYKLTGVMVIVVCYHMCYPTSRTNFDSSRVLDPKDSCDMVYQTQDKTISSIPGSKTSLLEQFNVVSDTLRTPTANHCQ